MSGQLPSNAPTRAARLTPAVPAGIATLMVYGPDAVATVESLAELAAEQAAAAGMPLW